MPYYVVNTGRIRLGGAATSRGTHIMWSKTPSTPDPGSPEGIAAQLIWFGGNAKTTLCGLPALRNVSDVFTPGEASCRECRKRWQLAMAEEQARARREAERRQRLQKQARRQAERRQQYREMPGLDRSAEDAADAGASHRAAVRYESGSDRWRRRYLSRHPAVARQLFPAGVPAEEQSGPPPQDAADQAVLRTMAAPGIPPAERYRAAFQERSVSGVEGKMQLIGDYPSVGAARGACQIRAGASLDWHSTPVQGMTGAIAVNTATGASTAYAVLDRWTMQARTETPEEHTAQQARTETPEEHTARLRAQVWKLYDQGMRVERISATLGIPVDTVERYLGKP